MLPLIFAGILGILPFLPAFYKITKSFNFGFGNLSFLPSSHSTPSLSKSDLLYFYLDPGSLPAVDLSTVGGKVLPSLLFPVVSGPHCTAELDFAPQPVCFAIVDDPEFYGVSPYLLQDTFEFPWEVLQAKNLVFAAWWIALAAGIVLALSLFLPVHVMNEMEERAYPYFLALRVHGADGLGSLLLGESLGILASYFGLSNVNPFSSTTEDQGTSVKESTMQAKPLDEGCLSAHTSVVTLQEGTVRSRSPSSPVVALIPVESSCTLDQASSVTSFASALSTGQSWAVEQPSASQTLSKECSPPASPTLSASSSLISTTARLCQAAKQRFSQASLSRKASRSTQDVLMPVLAEGTTEQEAKPAQVQGNDASSTVVTAAAPTQVSAIMQARSSRALAAFAGRSLKSLYTASKQYQHADSPLTPESPSSEEAFILDDPTDMPRLTVNASRTRIRFLSGGAAFGLRASAHDAYLRAQQRSAINFGTVARTLRQEEEKTAQLEAAAFGRVPPLGFDLVMPLGLNPLNPLSHGPLTPLRVPALPAALGDTPSSQDLAHAPKYIPPPLRRTRSQTVSPQSPGPRTPDDVLSTRVRVCTAADSPSFSPGLSDVDSPLAHKRALTALETKRAPRRARRTTSGLRAPRGEQVPSPGTPVRLLVGPDDGGEPFARMRAKRTRQVSVALPALVQPAAAVTIFVVPITLSRFVNVIARRRPFTPYTPPLIAGPWLIRPEVRYKIVDFDPLCMADFFTFPYAFVSDLSTGTHFFYRTLLGGMDHVCIGDLVEHTLKDRECSLLVKVVIISCTSSTTSSIRSEIIFNV
ncbi:hypothetical protein K488DRAFT_86303 [Vararia minispora EC-137]|uniref:Uncharacterized protein n=1 Tax=Vararia minispora EC-137 TaxID=1314806 RepID=A0ACB8QK62_9AGAM|nr:hypothetical protein K488DRAFT_86303 [Vararia minispora EC-137]